MDPEDAKGERKGGIERAGPGVVVKGFDVVFSKLLMGWDSFRYLTFVPGPFTNIIGAELRSVQTGNPRLLILTCN